MKNLIKREVEKFEKVIDGEWRTGDTENLLRNALTRISQATREDLLAKLPKEKPEKEYPDDIHSACGGNFDDAYDIGTSAGETWGHNSCLSEIRKIIKGI